MMKSLMYRRIVGLGFVNFWRNRWLSIGAIITLSLCLLAMTSFTITTIVLKTKIQELKEKIDIIAYFNDSVSEEEISNLELQLSSRSDVKSVAYTSKDDAIKVFQSRPTSDRVKSLITVENNPLPRSLQIKPNDQSGYDRISALLSGPAYKDKIWRVSSEENAPLVRTLNQKFAEEIRNGYVFSGIFVVIAAIVLVNTLRMILFSRRSEIEVMRLVGASNIFIRAPFLIEAFLFGLIGALISTLVLLVGLKYSVPLIPSFASSIFTQNDLNLYRFSIDHLPQIVLYQILIGVLLSCIFSMISISRHLKK